MKSVLIILLLAGICAAAQVGGEESPGGAAIQCDYPRARHILNSVGTDGSGLCVFASLHQEGDWQGDPLFSAMFEWMKRHPGGGYPSKVDAMLKRAAKELGLPVPRYLNVEGNDLELIRAATRNGLMPCTTYSSSPTGRYGGRRISHMVNTAHADDKWFAVLDNNYPGSWEWMNESQYLHSFSGGSQGWMVILLTDAPPPPPKGARR